MKSIIKQIMPDKQLTATMQTASIGQAYLFTLVFTGKLFRGLFAGL